MLDVDRRQRMSAISAQASDRDVQRKDEVKPSVRLRVRSSELFCQIRGMTLVLLSSGR